MLMGCSRVVVVVVLMGARDGCWWWGDCWHTSWAATAWSASPPNKTEVFCKGKLWLRMHYSSCSALERQKS